MAKHYIDALNSGYKWNDSNITYSYDSITGNNSDGTATNYTLFNTAQKIATDAVFDIFESVANVTFTNKTSNNEKTDVVLRAADMPEGVAGWAYYANNQYGSDLTIDNNYDGTSSYQNYEGLNPGQFGFRLIIHEVGHIMGLEHPHDGTVLASNQDSQNASVMSYNAGSIATRVGPTAAQTLQIYDIATLQYLYGANQNYNAGNNTYTLDGNIYVGTIWDGNGNDTYNSTSYLGDVKLDLREGVDNVSTVGATNVWAAFGANIENAVSGDGNDIIYGNNLSNSLTSGSGNDIITGYAGDDSLQGNRGIDDISGGEGNDIIFGGKDNDIVRGGQDNDYVNGNIGNDSVYGGNGNDILHGGKNDDTISGGNGNDTISGDLGNDILEGGTGADIFVFNGNFGADIITDFNRDEDIIQLSNTSNKQIMDYIKYSGNDSIIDFGNGNLITIWGVGNGGLSTDDFSILG